MDISVLLALDTAAFEESLKAASAALGQFKAGADVCFEAVGRARERIDAAAEAAAKEAAAVTEAAEAAREHARAEAENAKATTDAAAACGGMFASLSRTKSTVGAAVGMFKQFAAVVKAVSDAADAAAERMDSIRLGNLAAGAENAARNFGVLIERMERADDVADGLDAASDMARRIDQEKQLAQLEAERAKALLSGGDADAVNRTFDARRREMEFGFRRAESADAAADIERQRQTNAAKIAEMERRADELAAQASRYAAESQAMFDKAAGRGVLGSLIRGDWKLEKNRQYTAEGEKLGEKAAEFFDAAGKALEEIKALRERDKVLAMRQAAETSRGGLIDAQELAANIAAEAVAPAAKEAAGKAGREAGGSSWGQLSATGDRLARIGGFVGGSASAANLAREQVEIARRNHEILETIARNTAREEGAVLA